MAATTLRNEFLCTLTGFVAPPREIGATRHGTRRFYQAIGGSFQGPSPAWRSALPTAAIGRSFAPTAFWNRMSELH
jgi:hypothetical protein